MNQEEEQALEQLFKEMIVVAELGQSNSGGSEVYSSIAKRLPYEFQQFMEYNASWVDTTVLDKSDLVLAMRLIANIRTFWNIVSELAFLRSLEISECSDPVRSRISGLKRQIEILCAKFNDLIGNESFVVMIRENPELCSHNFRFLEDARIEGMRIAESWHKAQK
jgi:hypothetical protein